MKEPELQRKLVGLLGPERFNKFLRAIADAKEKGRLFYWQEEVIAEAAKAGIVMPTKLHDLLTVASQFTLVQVPLAKEKFLLQPLIYLGDSDFAIPDEWVDEASAQPKVRDSLSYSLARSASKVGDFSLAAAALEILVRNSTPEEAVELYIYIRDAGHRLESEWRRDFEKAFPSATHKLPPIEFDPEVS